MKKCWLLFTICCVLFSSCKEKDEEPEVRSNRTLLVYMIAGNNLELDMRANIQHMVKGLAGVKKASRLVVYWDGRNGDPTISCYTTDSKGQVSGEVVQRTYPQQSATNEHVMQTVLKDMMQLNPDNHYGLIFSAHGTGWLPSNTDKQRAFGPDGKEWMEIPAMARALQNACTKPLDYILFDACLMADVQVAYELRNTSNYIIASVAEVLAQGFPYEQLIPYLYSDKVVDYTIAMPAAYIEYYRSSDTPWGTIATIRCQELERLAMHVKAVLERYVHRLPTFDAKTVQCYDRPNIGFTYAISDLRDFLMQLCAPEVPTAALKQLERTLAYSEMIDSGLLKPLDLLRYSGLGVYIPQPDRPLWNDFFRQYAWCEAAGFSLFF